MPTLSRSARLLGAFLAFLSVGLGAMAAHFLKPRLLAAGGWETWHTAVYYQGFHALALLALASTLRRGPLVCWGLGVLFFSGSLYVLALDPTQKWAGPMTPLGGLLFLVGWLWYLINLPKER